MRSEAIVFVGPGEVELGAVEVPDRLEPTDVLVRTRVSGLSTGTERWLFQGRFYRADSPSGGERSFPLVPGYQKVGVVERMGTDVRAFRPGERVFCTSGRIVSGARPAPSGLARGGHLRYSVQDQSEVISLPPGLDDAATAGLVLAQVGLNGGSRPSVESGDVAVVLGDGLVGQYAAQTLRARGARVLLSGRRPFRLELARRHSADAVHDARAGAGPALAEAIEAFGVARGRGDREPLVWRRHPGLRPTWLSTAEAALEDRNAAADERGADVIVDTTGSAEAVRLAAGLLRRHGHLVLLGWYPEPENRLLEDWLHGREIAMHGTGGWRRERLLAALGAIAAGWLKTAALVTHRAPVGEAPRVYRELLLEKREEFLGVVFDWGE